MHVNIENVSQIFSLDNGEKIAVNNISLEIDNGERVGIVGSNGAGKTTLLQLIAGLATPTKGVVSVDGHVNCIMTLGVGLREELTGRENVYIDGELNGKTQEEIESIIDDILDFSELANFADLPVRTYSTGMKARLAFAMITYIVPGILIIDEALSAGDSQFAAKASAKMKEICSKGKVLILVSHSMRAITDMCDRCVWMEDGRIVEDGNPAEVTEHYMQATRVLQEKKMLAGFRRLIGGKTLSAGFAIEQVQFLDIDNNSRNIFMSDQEMTVRVDIRTETLLRYPDIRITFERIDANIMLRNTASGDGCLLDRIDGFSTVYAETGVLMLGQNTYQVIVELLDREDEDSVVALASYNTILKVEKPVHVLDDPAYFAHADVSVEKLGSCID